VSPNRQTLPVTENDDQLRRWLAVATEIAFESAAAKQAKREPEGGRTAEKLRPPEPYVRP
jgi:hypothetical protein